MIKKNILNNNNNNKRQKFDLIAQMKKKKDIAQSNKRYGEATTEKLPDKNNTHTNSKQPL
jgi:hypothetical protein